MPRASPVRLAATMSSKHAHGRIARKASISASVLLPSIGPVLPTASAPAALAKRSASPNAKPCDNHRHEGCAEAVARACRIDDLDRVRVEGSAFDRPAHEPMQPASPRFSTT